MEIRPGTLPVVLSLMDSNLPHAAIRPVDHPQLRHRSHPIDGRTPSQRSRGNRRRRRRRPCAARCEAFPQPPLCRAQDKSVWGIPANALLFRTSDIQWPSPRCPRRRWPLPLPKCRPQRSPNGSGRRQDHPGASTYLFCRPPGDLCRHPSGLLRTPLPFLDQNSTMPLVNAPSQNPTKSPDFHFDRIISNARSWSARLSRSLGSSQRCPPLNLSKSLAWIGINAASPPRGKRFGECPGTAPPRAPSTP